MPLHEADVAAIGRLLLPKRLKAACSSLVSSPMLIGLFRPLVVLPQFAYVKNGREQQLKYAVLHKLTHYKRKDLVFKWFAAAVTCVQWFNHLMILPKEIKQKAGLGRSARRVGRKA